MRGDFLYPRRRNIHQQGDLMNVWKPLTIISLAGFVFTIGSQVAQAGGPCFDQPRMAEAVSSLKQARAALDHAEHNQGGWRDAAISATNTAIKEADRGCAFANAH